MRCLLLMFCLCLAVAAETVPIEVPPAGGPVTLPMTGLSLQLPARSGVTCKIRGRWGLSEQGSTFWSRDVIDETDASNKLVAGTWVSMGYFDAGEDRAVARSSAELAKLAGTWETTTTLWGRTFAVAGGLYDFHNSLGVRPALILATSVSKNRPSLVLHYYFLNAETSLDHDAMLQQLAEAATPASVMESYSHFRCEATEPTHSQAVTQPGGAVALRAIQLPKTSLKLQLPDDGFVWLEDRDRQGTTDFLNRMAPMLPEVTAEIALIPNSTPSNVLASLKGEASALSNVPTGWTAGPTLTTSGGDPEVTLAASLGQNVLLVGLLGVPPGADCKPFQKLLLALMQARP